MWKWKTSKSNSAPSQIYRKEISPTRKLFLWGFDEKHNPSFLILYGKHSFKQHFELEKTVTYTESLLFMGNKGHFPSFEAVKVLDHYDYKTKKKNRAMHYKKDIQGNGYWCNAEKGTAIQNFRIFNEKEQLTFSYFDEMPYEEYVKGIRNKNLIWNHFNLANNPNEVLHLDEEFIDYLDIFIQLFTNPNIYMRKKLLCQLIDSNPCKKLYDYILEIGSSELISGLLLELGRRKDPIILKEVQNLAQSDNIWAGDNYGTGIKRCAELYLLALRQTDNNDQIAHLRQNLSDMDLHLLYVNGKKLSPGKTLEGKEYRKFALGGVLAEYNYYYNYETREYINKRNDIRYKQSIYSDGVILHASQLKNTLQTAELLDLPDVLGKIAYYLDAPRLHYYFRGVGHTKSHHYFKRYIRRILDAYAKEDESKFIIAMKALFTSYTNGDYLCKFKGNFQFNYFIKHYLYYDFQEKTPQDWYARYKWMQNDQLAKLEGRFEMRHDLWDRHLDDVIDILSNSNINVISKAFYSILQSPANQTKLQNLSYEQLSHLAVSTYEPAAKLFMEILINKIKNNNLFDTDIMLSLMQCKNDDIHEIALDYFRRTNGTFSAIELANLLLSNIHTDWEDLFIGSLLVLDEQGFIDFVKAFIQSVQQSSIQEIIFSDELKNALLQTANKIKTVDCKVEILSFLLSVFQSSQELPATIQEIAEQLIFTNSYEDLKNLLGNHKMTMQNTANGRNKMLFRFLQSIINQDLPTDTIIVELLSCASAGMLRTLISMIRQLQSQLCNRFSTCLILMESDVLALNEIVKNVFQGLALEEQKRLLAVLLDSPDERTFSFSLQKLVEIYNDLNTTIPKEQLLPMLEHPSAKVRAFVSDKIRDVISQIGLVNKELFLYYAKTLLYLPNKVSFAKQNIYEALPYFVQHHPDVLVNVEQLLIDLGGSNFKIDSERALVALAKIKKEVVSIES